MEELKINGSVAVAGVITGSSLISGAFTITKFSPEAIEKIGVEARVDELERLLRELPIVVYWIDAEDCLAAVKDEFVIRIEALRAKLKEISRE